MLNSSLCDYNDAYVLVSWTTTIAPAPLSAVNPNSNDKELVFKNCIPFTDCISEINNIQIDNAIYIDVVMSIYNLE